MYIYQCTNTSMSPYMTLKYTVNSVDLVHDQSIYEEKETQNKASAEELVAC